MTSVGHRLEGRLDVARTLEQGADLIREPFVAAGRDDVVVLEGWAFDIATSAVPRVFARIGGALLPAAKSKPRGDVAAVHGPAAAASGFVVALAVAAFDGAFVDVELMAQAQDGVSETFAARRIVVVEGDAGVRSDRVILDGVCDVVDGHTERALTGAARFDAQLKLTGWAYALGTDGVRYPAVAAVVDGRRVYQATYGRPRPDVFEHLGIGPDVGFVCEVSALRLGPGSHDVRIRLVNESGAAVECAAPTTVEINSL